MAAGWQRLSWTASNETRDASCENFCAMADSLPVISCANATNINQDEMLHNVPPNGVTFDAGGPQCEIPGLGRANINGSVNGRRIDVQCSW